MCALEFSDEVFMPNTPLTLVNLLPYLEHFVNLP